MNPLLSIALGILMIAGIFIIIMLVQEVLSYNKEKNEEAEVKNEDENGQSKRDIK